MKSKISIIIPVYNGKAFLEKCITSVLNQTYLNLEIICIDDGSTDGSSELLDAFASRDSRMIVFHKENGGVSSARNVGLDNATGDYIGFVDSDDYCLPNMYEVMLDKMLEHEADAIVCAFVNKEKKGQELETIFSGEEAVIEMNEGGLFMGHLHNKLIKRSLVGNQKFDTNIAILEDLLYLNETLYEAKKVVYLNKGLYFYRDNEDSALNNKVFKRSYLSRIEACNKIEEFLAEKGILNNLCIKKLKFYTYYHTVRKICIAPNKMQYISELKMALVGYRKYYEKSFVKGKAGREKMFYQAMKYNVLAYFLLILLQKLKARFN